MKHFCILILFFQRLVPPLLTVCTFAFHSMWMHGSIRLSSTFVVSLCFMSFFIFQALMVWLWGINLWFFSQGGVNYAKIFDLDQSHLTHREIWKVSTHHFDLSLVWHIKSAFARSKGNKNGSVMTWEQEQATIFIPIFGFLKNGLVLSFLSSYRCRFHAQYMK